MTAKRWVLLNPGPVNVSERVRCALLGPDICHREEEFSELLYKTRQKLLRLFGVTQTHTAAFFTGSGTAALEAMLSSFADPQKKILVLSNGVYGRRIRTILETYNGTPVKVLSSEAGSFPDLKKIESVLKKDGSIHAVAMVHHETSTGMLNPLHRVGAIAKKYDKAFLVDAVSSLGGEKIDFRTAGISLLAGTSGKCLHGFPGLSFVIVSKKISNSLQGKRPKSLYLDLLNALQHQERNDTPFTPAVQLFYAFREALDELETQGLKNRIASYEKKSALLEKGFIRMKLDFLIPPKHRSHVLTAVRTPAFISYQKLHGELKKAGFVIYAGQSELAGRIFRVANLGNVTERDIKNFLHHLKTVISRTIRSDGAAKDGTKQSRSNV